MNIEELCSRALLERLSNAGLYWRVGPFVVGARTGLRDVAREIAFLYAHFPLVETAAVVDADVSIRARGPLGRWVRVSADGQHTYNWFRRHLAVPLFEWAVNLCLFHRPHQYLILHSAVVEKGGRAVIMPAPPGSGKSTLCAALVSRGWRLLSDEVALVQPNDGRLMPVPRPISLKEESIQHIRDFAPHVPIGPAWQGTPKGTLAHMQPPAESARRAQETARPGWLIFPRYQQDAKAELKTVTKGRSLMRAAENSFNYDVLGQRGFETLATLVDDCECYEFVYSDLADAVEQFELLQASQALATAAAW